MTRFRLDGLRPNYATGTQTGSFIAKVADATSNFACGLYKNYPASVVENPSNSFLRGVWDSLCDGRPPGLPNTPVPRELGGQCQGEIYLWRPTSSYYAPGDLFGWSASHPGVLTMSVGAFTPVPGTSPVEGFYEVTVRSNGTVVSTPGSSVYGFEGEPPQLETAPFGSFTDDCGNGQPQWPNSPPPPPGWESGDITITNNDGLDVAIPLVYAPITGELNAEFNVNIGEVNLKFDLGGIEVTIGDNDGTNEPPPDLDDKLDDIIDRLPTSPTDPGNGGSGTNEPPTSVPPPTDPPPATNPDLDSDTKDPSDPKEEDSIEDLRYVCVNLTKLPDKTQFGNGAPDVHFAGWFEFKSGNCCFPRQQINFIESLFPAPPGSDGYAYTLTNGAEGTATVYTRKPETNA